LTFLELLTHTYRLAPRAARTLLLNMTRDQLLSITEVIVNTLAGHLKVSSKPQHELARFRTILRKAANIIQLGCGLANRPATAAVATTVTTAADADATAADAATTSTASTASTAAYNKEQTSSAAAVATGSTATHWSSTVKKDSVNTEPGADSGTDSSSATRGQSRGDTAAGFPVSAAAPDSDANACVGVRKRSNQPTARSFQHKTHTSRRTSPSSRKKLRDLYVKHSKTVVEFVEICLPHLKHRLAD